MSEEKIIQIIKDSQEYWQPDMIIEKGEPFFWRINPQWIHEVAKKIATCLKK
jgi:hypothetical protein